MKKQEVIYGLESLIADRESFITGDEQLDAVFVKDKEILEEAIKLIKEEDNNGE